MRYRLQWFIHLQDHGLRKQDEQPADIPSLRTLDLTLKRQRYPYSSTERRVPELIPDLGSQPAGDANHKPGGRLPLLSARPAVTLATFKRAATSFAAW